MALMKFAHVFTGSSSDAGSSKASIAGKAVQTSLLNQSGFAQSANKPRFVTSGCLKDEEDDRWLQVEGGSPLNVRWSSCPRCSFLNAVSAPACKACGMKPVSSRSESAAADEKPSLDQSAQGAVSQSSSPREVIVTGKSPSPRQSDDGNSTVSRHNLIAEVFAALGPSRNNLVSPVDLQHFSQIAGLSHGFDDHTWALIHADVANQYGWDPSKGAHLGQFIRCIDDVGGRWYCPTGVLWTLLARIDKQEESLARLDERDYYSHTSAAIARGHAPLDIDFSTGAPLAKKVLPEAVLVDL